MRRAVLLATLLLAAPAAGDWLVMRDGTRIETSGTWEVKGRQVIFTPPGGSLAALRLADVDLGASEEATAESRAPAPEAARPESPKRRPVMVLTNDDLPSGGTGDPGGDEAEDDDEAVDGDTEDDGAGGDGEDGDGENGGDAAPSAAAEAVTIVSWHEQESQAVDGLEIVGSVRNGGTDVAAGVRVRVQVPDEDGGVLVDTSAFLQRSSLAPGHSSSFRALLPGIYTLLETPTFEVTSETISIQGLSRPGGDTGEETPEEEDLEQEPAGR